MNRRISGASKRNQNGNKSSQLVWMYPPRRNPPTGPKKIKEKKDPPKRNASLPKTSPSQTRISTESQKRKVDYCRAKARNGQTPHSGKKKTPNPRRKCSPHSAFNFVRVEQEGLRIRGVGRGRGLARRYRGRPAPTGWP